MHWIASPDRNSANTARRMITSGLWLVLVFPLIWRNWSSIGWSSSWRWRWIWNWWIYFEKIKVGFIFSYLFESTLTIISYNPSVRWYRSIIRTREVRSEIFLTPETSVSLLWSLNYVWTGSFENIWTIRSGSLGPLLLVEVETKWCDWGVEFVLVIAKHPQELGAGKWAERVGRLSQGFITICSLQSFNVTGLTFTPAHTNCHWYILLPKCKDQIVPRELIFCIVNIYKFTLDMTRET